MYTIVIPSGNIENLCACLARLKEPDVITIHHSPFVFSKAINAGIRAAGKNDVIFLNDDALLETPKGFEEMQALALAHADFGIISSQVKGEICNDEQRPQELPFWLANQPMVAFVCVYVPRHTIETVGFLDEQFVGYGYEDDDYCRRVRSAGLKIAVSGKCLVEHASLPSVFRSGKTYAFEKYSEMMTANRKLFEKKWQGKPAAPVIPAETLKAKAEAAAALELARQAALQAPPPAPVAPPAPAPPPAQVTKPATAEATPAPERMPFSERSGPVRAPGRIRTFDPPLLSILICGIEARRLMARKLIRALSAQINALENPEQVEIRYFCDAGELTVGAKRNRLLKAAEGLYSVFIDDDDRVMCDYVDRIVEACREGKDCVGTAAFMTRDLDGSYLRLCRNGPEYNGRADDGQVITDRASHLCPIRTSIAKSVPFPEINCGEDRAWMDTIFRKIKTWVTIPDPIYYYDFRFHRTSTEFVSDENERLKRVRAPA